GQAAGCSPVELHESRDLGRRERRVDRARRERLPAEGAAAGGGTHRLGARTARAGQHQHCCDEQTGADTAHAGTVDPPRRRSPGISTATSTSPGPSTEWADGSSRLRRVEERVGGGDVLVEPLVDVERLAERVAPVPEAARRADPRLAGELTEHLVDLRRREPSRAAHEDAPIRDDDDPEPALEDDDPVREEGPPPARRLRPEDGLHGLTLLQEVRRLRAHRVPNGRTATSSDARIVDVRLPLVEGDLDGPRAVLGRERVERVAP